MFLQNTYKYQMKNYAPKYRTKSNRLKEYDYTQPAWYYVTICTNNREQLFGEISDSKIIFNKSGKIANSVWKEIPDHFPNVEIDEFVIMPNHIHGIIIINEHKNINDCRNTACCVPTESINPKFGKIVKGSLGVIVRSFKSAVTKRINENRNVKGSIWQSNYYDHIIRNEKDLFNIRKYIQQNPLKWELDEYYNL